MRRKLFITLALIGFGFTALAEADDATPLIKKLSGAYVHRVQFDVSGKPVHADNDLEILPYKDDLAYFHIFLNFTNMHMCEISGIAEEQDNHLVYSAPNADNQDESCTFSIGFANGEIALDDKYAACQRVFCSANGSFQEQEKYQFQDKDKSIIKNVKIIKESQDYKDAVNKYTGPHP